MATIAVAGASGFVGTALIAELKKNHRVIALTRGDLPPSEKGFRLHWAQCDLFSLLETENALDGADIGIYLVHSMLPSAQLTQGNFQDLDLLVADNFARAAHLRGLKQIIYLGGIIPPNQTLSSHLKSRMEVETSLGSHNVPLTTLRAGMILGGDGSSMNIMVRLVRRLPVMICPAWTQRRSQPIYIDDVVASIQYVMGREESYNRVYDLAGPTQVKYREMMIEAGHQIGRELKTFSVPFVTPNLSRLWVTLITGAPKNLIAPLINTLKNDMLPDENRLMKIPGREFLGYKEALRRALEEGNDKTKRPRAFILPEGERRKKTVRSVQRLYLPEGLNAVDVADLYISWLPRHFATFFRVRIDGDKISFIIPLFNINLLVLEKSTHRSSSSRQLFYIRGGVLAKTKSKGRRKSKSAVIGRGRLEFRQTYDSRHILVAIHDFKPTLPWYLYRATQAMIHYWVMRSFDNYLRSYAVPRKKRKLNA